MQPPNRVMELPVENLLTVDQAIAILDAVPLQPHVVRLPLLDAADLFLAEDIYSDRDYPPFDKAMMDGFAIRSTDVQQPGVRLAVVDTVAAGQVGQRPIGPGEAVAIMTGAPIPPGADAVVPVERTTRDSQQVTILQPIQPNQSIARRGSDTSANRLLITRGIRLGPAQIAVAASVGKASLPVYARPRVAVLSTGDELISADEVPAGSQIRNANGPMLHALLQRLGCTVLNLGIVLDQRDALRSAIAAGLEADALFITGGMSMGERDYVPALLRELGLDLMISKLRIKPGKPFAFGVGGSKSVPQEGRNPALAFGLPGNPVSAFVCTMRLASRVLARLAGGQADVALDRAAVTEDLPANGLRELYSPAVLQAGGLQPLSSNGSADLFTLTRASALIIRREYAPACVAGTELDYLKI